MCTAFKNFIFILDLINVTILIDIFKLSRLLKKIDKKLNELKNKNIFGKILLYYLFYFIYINMYASIWF